MKTRISRISIFEQSFDRAAATVYFLGAVVPLGALGWLVIQRLRPLGLDVRADWFIAVLGLIGGLTLLSFFALRRLTRTSMRIIDRESANRARLLAASRALAAETDAAEVRRLAADAVSVVGGTRSGLVFARGRGGELELDAAGGGSGRSRAEVEECKAAAEEALRTLDLVEIRSSDGRGRIAAMPCVSGGRASTAIVSLARERSAQEEGDHDLLSTLGALTAIALSNAELREAERNFFTHVTNLLVATLDRHLDDRSDHSRRVAAIANQISRTFGLDEQRRERLHFAALLHDIGMLQIPRAHADDRMLARRHVELGDEMLRPIRLWEDLAGFVRHHHERWDGTGYPDRLAGEEIPLESRIIAVAEAFDVMTAEKSYKSSIPAEAAVGRLQEASGSQFDPAVVAAFVTARSQEVD